MSAPQTPPAFVQTRQAMALPGFAYGLRYPSLLVWLRAEASRDFNWLSKVDSFLVDALPGVDKDFAAESNSMPEASADQQAAKSLLYWIHQMQCTAAGLPVFERGKLVIGELPDGGFVAVIPTPPRGQRSTRAALSWLLTVFNAAIAAQDFQPCRQALPAVLAGLRKALPSGLNVPRFLRAAYELGFPSSEIPGQVVQLGYGARARWMDSSFTDETPQISARLARNKHSAAAIMRRAGIPVPDHAAAGNINEAVQHAERLGYPVVVKPANRDGGNGVAAGLTTPGEVQEAFAAARKHSNHILVEKHFDGRDYRLVVFQGELIWAVERVPGGITGDGSSSIQALLDQLNADPRRGDGPHAPLKRLVLDDEARALLRQAGLDTSNVPPAGKFVRLRRTANVATGGTPVAVFDRVHPDNRSLAKRAAAALRLDLAGIDLLIPDISQSWRKTGAAVCEVNGQPNLGQMTTAHLYAPILQKLVPGNGRIPIALVVGAPPEANIASQIADRLAAAGLRPGWADRDGVRIDGETVVDGTIGVFDGGQILMMDKGVKSAVLSISDASVLRTGLPFDRFDVLILAGQHLNVAARPNGPAAETVLRNVLLAVLPACQGKVMVLAETDLKVSVAAGLTCAEWRTEPIAGGQAVKAVTDALIASDATHGSGRGLAG